MDKSDTTTSLILNDEESTRYGEPSVSFASDGEKYTEETVDDDINKPPYPYVAMTAYMVVTVGTSITQAGLNAILALYFSQWLGFSDKLGTITFSIFTFLYNAVAPVGGILTDRVLGNFKTQVYFNIIWCVGCVLQVVTVLPHFDHSKSWAMYILVTSNICLQAIGYGIINPIQSVFVADQFPLRSQAQQLTTCFAIFYFWTNVGDMVGEAAGPILREYASFLVSVSAMTVILALSTVIMIASGPAYIRAPIQKQRPSVSELKDDMISVWPIIKIFLVLPIFWSLFYQQNSTWVYQAKEMDLHLGKVKVPPDLMPSLEDVAVLVWIPIFDPDE
eukprot:TRINITY_DN6043_c0_g1_i1.p1 TRINITY_DN6043_c0_g1~~TRINITY_DN6043_c0_g1_i1.p1  ORF type:complete len:347 (+),score=41.94 TRINITY_DN6043_c0_g1_i1:44-1042(+)